MPSGDSGKRPIKILCVSDHVDPLVYSPLAAERFGDVDLVISAGDLSMKYLGFISSMLNKPVVFVFGNHNLEHMHLFRKTRLPQIGETCPVFGTDDRFGATFASDRVIRVNGLIIVGLGGSMRYNAGENQYTEFQMMMRILRLSPRLVFNRLFRGRYLDILLTHAAPRGIHDRTDRCHLGFKSFRWFMRVFRPRYLLHGHIHLYDQREPRLTRYFATDVINVYDHYLLEY